MKAYDVIIVGSGTGGQTAAYHLNEKGLNITVVEDSDRPGGVCALYGCQPKKWFYEVTESIAKARHLKGKGLIAPPARRVVYCFGSKESVYVQNPRRHP